MVDGTNTTTAPVADVLRARIAAAANSAEARVAGYSRFEQAVEVVKDTVRAHRRIQRRVWDTPNPAALLKLLAAADTPGPVERVVWDAVAQITAGDAVPTEEQLLAEIARQETAMGDSPGDWTELVSNFVILLKCAIRSGIDIADLVPLLLRRRIDREHRATLTGLAADPAPPPPTSFTTDPLCRPARSGQSPGAATARSCVKVAVPA